jgi:hypothetical protein
MVGFVFAVERNDDGDLALGFNGFPSHTHGDILASLSGLPVGPVIRQNIDALLSGRSAIALARVAGKIREGGIMSALATSAIVFACIFGGSLLGIGYSRDTCNFRT